MYFKRKLFITFSFLLFLFIISPSFAGSLNYQYDALNRLTRIGYPNGTIIEYAYDKVGNRLTKTFIVLNMSDQIIQSGTYTANSFTIGPNVTIAGGAEVIFNAEQSISISSNILIDEYAQVTFRATSITAEDNFVIRNGAVVVFETSDQMTLGPNFIIRSGAAAIFEALGHMTLGPDFIVESGSEALFRAGDSITILPEFTAEEGCTLEITTL
ncbi:MAG: hypothetical protein ACMUJM_00710 [bacterium]